jgi:hypothetical protein
MDGLRDIIAANPNGISRAGMLAWAQLRIDPGYDEARLDADLAALVDELDDSSGFYRLRSASAEGAAPATPEAAMAETAAEPSAAEPTEGGIVGWAPPGAAAGGAAAPTLEDAAALEPAVPAGPTAGISGWVSPDPAAPTTGAGGAIPGWGSTTDTAGAAGDVPGAEAAARGGFGGIIRRFWILGVIGLIAVGAVLFRDRITGSAADLAVGDCFDLPGAEVTEIEDVQHHPCNEPHSAEVFVTFDYPGATDAYPSQDEFSAAVSARCLPEFTAYTGSEFEQQQSLDIYWLYPLQEGWDDGDHEVVCSLFRIDEQPLTQSMRGANPT